MAQRLTDTTGMSGLWEGSLKVSGIALPLIFHISPKDGVLTGTMDSPDQGAKDIPISVTIHGDSVWLNVRSSKTGFAGKLSSDRKAMNGQWNQAGQSIPLDLVHHGNIVEQRRPQEPVKPYPYEEEDVKYINEKAGITLAGTLTRPKKEGKFPGVILITGSGPQDRNEALMGHKPFLVLADYLTRQGMAVLRVDDRGIGQSTGNFATATSEDFASDVLAGIAYLKARPDIDVHRIGLIGHSEGGIIAPMVAVQSPDVAFIVLMAGPGTTGEEILYAQGELLRQANGDSKEEIARERALQAQFFTAVKQTKDEAALRQQLEGIIDRYVAMNGGKDSISSQLRTQLMYQIPSLLSPWMRLFLIHDPRPTLQRVKCPVLALNGSKDLQVPPKENLKEIEKALKMGGNTHYKVMELPGLNHLFQTAKTGSPDEYTEIEETISPIALQTMGDWIREQIRK